MSLILTIVLFDEGKSVQIYVLYVKDWKYFNHVYRNRSKVEKTLKSITKSQSPFPKRVSYSDLILCPGISQSELKFDSVWEFVQVSSGLICPDKLKVVCVQAFVQGN